MCENANPSGGIVRRGIEGLLYGKLAAGAFQDALYRAGFHKLESVAKSVPLSDQRKDFDLAQRDRELEAHDLSDRNLLADHGRNTGLADVYGMATHHR